ncbi:PQQ-binding-like beta-propeller repeat protein [Nonomuraea sp. NPDC050451]|uniref:outer membrane protein assembly factor BamB family protein n=1 Tax=Nonomuraea sp. NPDC050451 TaxID=3364364 RepID=UPI00378E3BB6
MWRIRLKAIALVCVVLLAMVAWPGEIIGRAAGPPGEPWQPPGRGTPPIDVLAEVSYESDLFGDVAVERRGPGVAAVRLADGADSWVYQRFWADDFVDWVRVDDQRIAVVWRDGRVALINVATGRIVWHADLPAGPDAELSRTYDEEWPVMWEVSVFGPGSLMILHDGRVDVLDTRTGAARWTCPFATCSTVGGLGGPGVHGIHGMGEVVLIDQGPEGEVIKGVARDAEDGTQRWTYAGGLTFITRDLGQGRMATIDHAGGELIVREAADGKILWRAGLKGLDTNDATILGVSDDLLTVDTPAEVIAYRIADGGVAWRTSFEGAPRRPGSVLTNGQVTYVRGDERTLIKLDARTGDVLDRRRFAEEIELQVMRDDLAKVSVGLKHHLVIA